MLGSTKLLAGFLVSALLVDAVTLLFRVTTMSLSSLNSPPLVAAAGVGVTVIMPFLEGADIPFLSLKCAAFVAYWINFGSVSVPGRIDGQSQDATKKGSTDEMEQLSTGRQGRTLVSPSGWAFAIWAPIFVGELVMVSALLLEPESGTMGPFIKKATLPFVAANVFQSLWCASFRPKYKGRWMLVSFGNLASTAYSLSKVHTSLLGLSGSKYFLYGLPVALHFGWTTAASLVNLNGAVAMPNDASAKTVAWVGHVSVVAATALGIFVTLSRKAPVYGGVIAWALAAVADGMTKRIAATKDEKDQTRVGVLGAKVQRRLSQAGSIMSAGASAAVSIMMLLGAKASSSKVAP